MPRTRKPDLAPVIPTNSLVASAVRYPGKAARIYNPGGDWQKECYRHYRICGEARFAAKFFGHALSRATLGIGSKVDGKIEPQNTGPAHDLLEELFNGCDGQEQMLESIGIHLTVAGECYLVGRKVQPDEQTEAAEVWEVVSVMEIEVLGKRWAIKYGDNQTSIPLADDDVVIRIWLPSPDKRIEADSPFRSLLPILTEIEYLTKHIFAQVQSRLAGAGVWVLPQGITFPKPPAINGVEQDYGNEVEGLTLTVGSAMMIPISQPDSPSALVPVFLQVPDDMVDKIKAPIHFWSPLDEEAKAMRGEAIMRFAVGMELPPEQILGMAHNSGTGGGRSNGVSHWGAWQIEESTIKMFVEPMLGSVVNALTIGYIRPVIDDPTSIVIYDTAALRLRPDRSQEAIEMYDRGAITLEAMLRENGFDPADMLEGSDLRDWLLRKIASGSATPEMVNAAAKLLGVDLGVVVNPTDMPNESRPAPSLEDHPDRPATPEYGVLVAACDGLVYRALERAGNRLRQGGSKPPGVPSYETHTIVPANGKEALLLDDAWPCALNVLEGVTENTQVVVSTLDAYVTHLLTTQTKHDRATMSLWLHRIPQLEAS